MAMDVWRRDDIANSLRAAVVAHQNPFGGDLPVGLAYDAGFYKAVAAIASAFGIQVSAVLPSEAVRLINEAPRTLRSALPAPK